jgi:hypothetical protein
MTLEGMPRFREKHGDTLDFILAATPEQLLEIAAGTAARGASLVTNFNNPNAVNFFHKTDDLRRMIVQQMRRHSDFRGMVIRAVDRMQVQGQGSQNQEGKKGKQQANPNPVQKKEK